MKKITSILMVVIGLVVIVLGASFQPEATSYDLTEKTFKYAAENYNLQYCAFGGDFYTEIYAASDMIVDVLDDINRSTETVVAVHPQRLCLQRSCTGRTEPKHWKNGAFCADRNRLVDRCRCAPTAWQRVCA